MRATSPPALEQPAPTKNSSPRSNPRFSANFIPTLRSHIPIVASFTATAAGPNCLVRRQTSARLWRIDLPSVKVLIMSPSRITTLLAALTLVCLASAQTTFGPSGWVADLNTRSVPSDPSGFRPLPLGGFLYNAKYNGDDQNNRRLVLYRDGSTTPLNFTGSRQEPAAYFRQSDTIGSCSFRLYFLGVCD